MSDRRRPVRVRRWLFIVLILLVWAVFNTVFGWDPLG